MNMETRNEKINAIRANIRKVLVGKEQLTDLILTAIIAEGHVLLEDVRDPDSSGVDRLYRQTDPGYPDFR
ncbi:hypothetical protein [Sellimonas intestinalis]|uniref:hypothetical protein n=1 Tax=Sellimonas intestinalis TaxID=1653434 RepID=UPI0015EB2F9E|nr:hypothetical protein [Sellimonas intestinalis]MBA2213680.1 hypothetical protein [Sellimonas intestinalis]